MESRNLTSSLSKESEPGNILLGVMYLVVGVLVMVSNGVVLFVIFSSKSLQQPTLWVISHMAFWDFVMGLYNVVISLPSALLDRFAYPKAHIGIAACFLSYLVSLVFFNVSTIVIDRLVCLRFPLAYARMKRNRYVFAAVVVHVLAVIRMILVSFPDTDFYYNKVAAMPFSNYRNFGETFLSLVFIVLALIIIIICCSLIVHTVKQRRRRICQEGLHVFSNNILKLSMMNALSAAVFCISFVPFVLAICWNLAVGHSSIPNWVVQLMILCILSNSIWNVLIYAANYRPFRESLIYIFWRSRYRAMLRKRHGIKSKADNKSSTVFRESRLETVSENIVVNEPSTSDPLQAPNHLFLASSAKVIH